MPLVGLAGTPQSPVQCHKSRISIQLWDGRAGYTLYTTYLEEVACKLNWQGLGSSFHWQHRLTSFVLTEQIQGCTERLCLNPLLCYHEPSHLHSLDERALHSQLMNQKYTINNGLVLHVSHTDYLCIVAQQGLGSMFHWYRLTSSAGKEPSLGCTGRPPLPQLVRW